MISSSVLSPLFVFCSVMMYGVAAEASVPVQIIGKIVLEYFLTVLLPIIITPIAAIFLLWSMLNFRSRDRRRSYRDVSSLKRSVSTETISTTHTDHA